MQVYFQFVFGHSVQIEVIADGLNAVTGMEAEEHLKDAGDGGWLMMVNDLSMALARCHGTPWNT